MYNKEKLSEIFFLTRFNVVQVIIIIIIYLIIFLKDLIYSIFNNDLFYPFE